VEEEVGDLLFSTVNAARHAGVDPETALRRANRKFVVRFGMVEAELAARGKLPEQATLEEMDSIWQSLKR
jgi:ATP diphosphatase